MTYSNETPGARFHEMQIRERARLRKLASRGDARAHEHIRALESLGANACESETYKRAQTRIAVAFFYAEGGYTERYTGAVVSGIPTERHRRFKGPAFERVRGYCARPLYSGETARAYRKVCGGR